MVIYTLYSITQTLKILRKYQKPYQDHLPLPQLGIKLEIYSIVGEITNRCGIIQNKS